MGIVIRKSLATTVFSYIGVVIGYLNILYFFPKYLEPSQIGLYRLVLDTAILLAPFAQSGIMQGIIRFYPSYNQKEEKKEFVLFSLVFFFLSFLIFCAILLLLKEEVLSLLFSENAGQLQDYYNLLIYLTLTLSFLAVFEGFARANLGVVLVNFLKDVFVRILTAVSIFFYFKEMIDFNQLVYSLLIIYGCAAIILFIHVVTKHKVKSSLKIKRLKTPAIKEIVKYNFFMVISAGSTLVVGKIDSLMISSFLGLESNGIYTTLFYVAVVIEIPKRAITQIVMPLYSKAFSKDSIKEVDDLYSKSALNQLIIGLLLYIGIVINLHNLFYFIPNGEEYEVGKWVIVIVGAAKLLDMAAGANGELIVMSKYFRFNVYAVTILAALTIISNIIFIPTFGINGAALASFITFLIFNLIKLAFIYKKYKLIPFSLNTVKVLAIGLLCFGIGYFLPFIGNNLIDLLIRSIIVLVAYSVLILTTKASEDINNFVNSVFRKFIKK